MDFALALYPLPASSVKIDGPKSIGDDKEKTMSEVIREFLAREAALQAAVRGAALVTLLRGLCLGRQLRILFAEALQFDASELDKIQIHAEQNRD